MSVAVRYSFTGAGGDPIHILRVSLSRERTTWARYANIRMWLRDGLATAAQAKELRAELRAAEVERKRLLARGRRGRIKGGNAKAR